MKRKRKHNVKACRRLSQPPTTKELAVREAITERLMADAAERIINQLCRDTMQMFRQVADEAHHQMYRLTLQTNVIARRN